MSAEESDRKDAPKERAGTGAASDPGEQARGRRAIDPARESAGLEGGRRPAPRGESERERVRRDGVDPARESAGTDDS